jgi:hypothetical protein
VGCQFLRECNSESETQIAMFHRRDVPQHMLLERQNIEQELRACARA